MRRKTFSILQWTWGLPQTLIGAGLAFKHRRDPHFDYNGARVTAWNRRDGISLGKFIFVPDAEDQFILEHEYGHSLQSAALGPGYLLLIGLPSMLWNRLPYFQRKRTRTGRSYYSAVFERTASDLGARARRRHDKR